VIKQAAATRRHRAQPRGVYGRCATCEKQKAGIGLPRVVQQALRPLMESLREGGGDRPAQCQ